MRGPRRVPAQTGERVSQLRSEATMSDASNDDLAAERDRLTAEIMRLNVSKTTGVPVSFLWSADTEEAAQALAAEAIAWQVDRPPAPPQTAAVSPYVGVSQSGGRPSAIFRPSRSARPITRAGFQPLVHLHRSRAAMGSSRAMPRRNRRHSNPTASSKLFRSNRPTVRGAANPGACLCTRRQESDDLRLYVRHTSPKLLCCDMALRGG
jgi:hypothetical protein